MHPDGKVHGGTIVRIKNTIGRYEFNKYTKDYLQATSIVIRDYLGKILISILNPALYCPPKHNIKKAQFEDFFPSLGSTYIVSGNFNAKHTYWCSRITTTKETGKYCSAVYLHITQAFARVWHAGLLYKLKINFPSGIINILKSHLIDRKETTCPSLFLNNVQIPKKNEVKHLDMHLDCRLNWKTHIIMKRKTSMKNLDKPWVPTSICNTCRLHLLNWENKSTKGQSVIQPTIWHEPKDHDTDCYFCLCQTKGFSKQYLNKIIYPKVKSVTPAKIGTVSHSENIVVLSTHESMDTDEIDSTEDVYCEDSDGHEGPKFFDQAGLDDFIRDLNLPKDKAELCASRLKERNLLLPGTKVTVYRKRGEQFIKSTFPHLSDAKVKEGGFVGPDIRKLMKDDEFIKTMISIEKDAWLSFKDVVKEFLGNNRDLQFRTIVSTMLQNFKRLGCLMSIKIHFHKCYLDYFPNNVGAFSEELGECFHQDFH
ncbi:PREDICTED: uncharacterized protein LOC106747274 [Dinoponera quadriceps]|uniref:Uncharacterized protein LOC106747274 n=1 Tax=Dinoponera quadriceps TaxID=609295 RepID=A0A6P3XNS7_DINQU|nr:PREDICTED: uncharacterized protein LOC106747274 [Dinoponera quadriceps]